jgi:hypothetical protein
MTADKDIKIEKTISYGKFKQLEGNRPINKGLLNAIRESINNDGNYLMYNPIIVNEKMEIIDGQHRLEAARLEAADIYYIMATGMRIRQAQVLNSRKRQWSSNDFLQSYLVEGKRDYETLKVLMDEYKFSVAICVKYLAKNNHQSAMKKFRDGKFEVVDRDWAEDCLGLLSIVRDYSPDYAYAQSMCQTAVGKMLDALRAAGNPRLFEEQLKRYQTTITRRNSTKDYLKEFQLILDMGGNSKIKLA